MLSQLQNEPLPSPEQFRALMRKTMLDMFSDPETLRLLLPRLATVFPIQGGMPTCTAGRLPKFLNSNCSSPTFEDSVIVESNGKIGIGKDIPSFSTHFSGDSSYAFDTASGGDNYIYVRRGQSGKLALEALSSSGRVQSLSAVDLELFNTQNIGIVVQNYTGNVGISAPSQGISAGSFAIGPATIIDSSENVSTSGTVHSTGLISSDTGFKAGTTTGITADVGYTDDIGDPGTLHFVGGILVGVS